MPLWARLVDRGGMPVAGARVAIEATHNLEAAHPLSAVAVTGPDGEIEVPLPLRHRGQWELRFDVTRGAERFTSDLRRELIAP